MLHISMQAWHLAFNLVGLGNQRQKVCRDCSCIQEGWRAWPCHQRICQEGGRKGHVSMAAGLEIPHCGL